MSFGAILFFTLFGAAGLLVPRGARIPAKLAWLLTPFPVRRRREMFAYVRRLVNEGHKSEVAVTRHRLAQARKGGEKTLPEVVVLERTLELQLATERAYKTQFKRLLASATKDDPDAFYFPSRMAAALALSLFTLGFLAWAFLQATIRLQQKVAQADVGAIGQIYRSLTVLQDQYQLQTGVDLPEGAGLWIAENADRIHRYLVSLADAIHTAAITSTVVSLLVFSYATVVLLLDFRGQIMQARRGMWQFNVAKVKLKAALTYVGSQVSNALFMFLIVALILELLLIIVLWQLTWDVLLWFVKTNTNLLISIVVVIIFNAVLKKVVVGSAGPGVVIKKRFLWMGYELYELLTQVAAGVV